MTYITGHRRAEIASLTPVSFDLEGHPATLAVEAQHSKHRISRVQSRNSQVAQRLWNMLQDVGVSWEYTDDTNWQSVATEQEELAELITAWPLLSPDLRVAILAIGRSVDVAKDDESSADSLSLPDEQRIIGR